MSWLAEMTRLGKIFDLLYFKGEIEDKNIQLKSSDKRDFDSDFIIMLSIIKYKRGEFGL